MAPQPVRRGVGSFELLAVHDAGDGVPDAEGHDTRHYRIYAGLVQDDGQAGVARVDRDLCTHALRCFMESFNR